MTPKNMRRFLLVSFIAVVNHAMADPHNLLKNRYGPQPLLERPELPPPGSTTTPTRPGPPQLEKRIWGLISAGKLAAAQSAIAEAERNYPGWHPSPAMEQVIAEKRIWLLIQAGKLTAARGAIADFERRFPDWKSSASLRKAIAAMRLNLHEASLWHLLGAGKTDALRASIQRMRKTYPGWKPPAALITAMHRTQLDQRLTILMKAREWQGVLALAAAHPGAFHWQRPYRMADLAQAYAQTGQAAHAAVLYQGLLDRAAAPKVIPLLREITLLPAREALPLFARASRRFPSLARAIAAVRLNYLLAAAARLHNAGADADAWQLLQPEAARIRGSRRAGAAALAGSILVSLGQQRAAAEWLKDAALWSDKPGDWLAYGQAALGAHDLAAARTALNKLPPGPMRERFAAQLTIAEGQQAYAQGRYADALRIFDQAARSGPLPSWIAPVRAWTLYHTHHYRQAASAFTTLYTAHPNKGDAVGLVLADYQTKNLAHAWSVSRRVQGPLGGLLPQDYMSKHVSQINEIPWRLLPNGVIAPPAPRSSSITLGFGAMARGGSGPGRLRELMAPQMQAQWGLSHRRALDLQIIRPLLHSGDLRPTDLPASSGAPASGQLTSGVSATPGFLVGLDDRDPHRHWNIAAGLTPGGGPVAPTLQGYAQYQANGTGGGWQVSVRRETVRQSLISYVGAQEKLQGPGGRYTVPFAWGRVMRNQVGINVHTAGSLSLDWMLHLDDLTGRNVRSNRGAETYLGLMHPILNEPGWWVSTGPSV
ncbi:MAG: BCSC C-terminal domain-containing protein, partial [Gammaproteobacteria bacterium]|nr:BCSC C-terminal domain-containing protein [Gammaproteobacteria bacterium]